MNYGNVNVNENYSALVEPNLYFDSVLQPGKTYTDQYQGDANSGLVKVYKHGGDGVSDPQAPASDFKHTNAENELINILLNNSQRKSKKNYRVAANAITYDLAETTLANATQDCKEGWQASGIACLAHEGTLLSDVTEITKDNIKQKIITARKQARKGKAVPNVVMASVDVYSTMLEAAGDQYTPVTNDNMVETGQIGKWLGMLWVECNQMELTSAKYFDHTSTLQTVNLSEIDFIMYDYRAFSVINNLEEMRIVDSTDFVGSLSQVEINTGYRVTTAVKVVIKKHSVAEVTAFSAPVEKSISSMNKAELEATCAELGIDIDGLTTNDLLRAAINAKLDENANV